MFYVVNFSQFDVKSILFPNFGQGPFPKNAGKGPVVVNRVLYEHFTQFFFFNLIDLQVTSIHCTNDRTEFHITHIM